MFNITKETLKNSVNTLWLNGKKYRRKIRP